MIYRKKNCRNTPLLVPVVDQFSNANNFVLDQLILETIQF